MIGKILLLVVTMVTLTVATPYGRRRVFSGSHFQTALPLPMPRRFGKYSGGSIFGQGFQGGFSSGQMFPGVVMPYTGMQLGLGGFQDGFGGFGTLDGSFDSFGGLSGGFGPSFGPPLPGFSSFDFQGPLDQFGGGFVGRFTLSFLSSSSLRFSPSPIAQSVALRT